MTVLVPQLDPFVIFEQQTENSHEIKNTIMMEYDKLHQSINHVCKLYMLVELQIFTWKDQAIVVLLQILCLAQYKGWLIWLESNTLLL